MSHKPVKVTLRSVTDGNTYDFVDDGESVKDGTPAIGRSRILDALKKRSRFDDKPAWRIVKAEKIQGCAQINLDRCEWGSDDDKRLEAHLEHRRAISSSAQGSSAAAARADAAAAAQAANVQAQIDVAVQAALAAVAATQAAPAPKAKAPKAPAPKSEPSA